jgi:hypothetical protein
MRAYRLKLIHRSTWCAATILIALGTFCTIACGFAHAQAPHPTSPGDVLSPREWERVNLSVDRGLDWVASRQQPDGSFPTLPNGQPAVTSLCTLAFLAHGHLPGEGPHGETVRRAIDYILACQKPNGVISLVAPNGSEISRNVPHDIGYTAAYNHSISGLVLSEAYAVEGAERARVLQEAVLKALQVSFVMQTWPKDHADDLGGWRYLHDYEEIDSDLSVTGWQLMFLRSAKNSGFDVPEDPIHEAVGYVRRCFLPQTGAFTYKLIPLDRSSRGVTGAGILALAHAGMHNTPEAQAAGNWILRSRFDSYNRPGHVTGAQPADDRYFYGLLTCCQAMYQLGGRHWVEFYPDTAKVIIANQHPDGSWDSENHATDRQFGNTYTSAICVMALGSANQLLPVFQR